MVFPETAGRGQRPVPSNVFRYGLPHSAQPGARSSIQLALSAPVARSRPYCTSSATQKQMSTLFVLAIRSGHSEHVKFSITNTVAAMLGVRNAVPAIGSKCMSANERTNERTNQQTPVRVDCCWFFVRHIRCLRVEQRTK